MGCGSSSAKAATEGVGTNFAQKTEIEGGPPDRAALQRRRLSVAPEQVGDITNVSVKDEQDHHLLSAPNAGKDGVGKGIYAYAADTRKGFVPYNRNKVNQDRHMAHLKMQDDEHLQLFGVMDGHGEHGHDVSSFVQEKLPQYLNEEQDLGGDVAAAIHNAVAKMEDELGETCLNIAFSGTTAIFSIRHNNMLYTANIGDSRAVMCRQMPSGAPCAIPLSFDQNPDNPKEKARILKAGGRVEPLPGLPGEDCGPARVWLADVDVPGLAMSRSIGDDVSHTVGVITTPEIIEHEIMDNDVFTIWASDGVWEFISNEQAVNIVWAHRDNLELAAKKLVQESEKRWKEEEEVVDDITCVIVGWNQATSASPNA